MKRCPKCNRTFPDDNQKFCTFDGGLLIAPTTFDPNITIRATALDLERATTESSEAPTTRAEPPRNERPATRSVPNFDETIAASAPTTFFPQSGGATSIDLTPPPTPSSSLGPAPAAPARVPLGATTSPPQPKKKSKLPWILAGVLLLFLLGGAGLAAVFFVFIKPRLEQFSQPPVVTETTPKTAPAKEQPSPATSSNAKPAEETKTEADTFVPPAGAVKFENSKANLDGKLAEHYVDFSFYYPGSWQKDPKAGVAGASNFARVFKKEKEDILESVAVSWYNSNGTYDSDVSIFPDRAAALSEQLSKSLPNYQKTSEGPTQVNSSKAYDFHFSGVSKEADRDLPYWGRVIFVPPDSSGQSNGVTIIMLVTGQSKEVHSEEEVGVKGEMPLILESFRFGRKE